MELVSKKYDNLPLASPELTSRRIYAKDLQEYHALKIVMPD